MENKKRLLYLNEKGDIVCKRYGAENCPLHTKIDSCEDCYVMREIVPSWLYGIEEILFGKEIIHAEF